MVVVAASALAFMNCGDDANSVNNAIGDNTLPGVEQPESSSSVEEPIQQAPKCLSDTQKHGFVVIATSESPDGTGRGKPALDWLEKKNNTPGDPLYQKLDMTKVGASGHSMGGLQSEQMLINDDRVITAVLNNSGAFNHDEATKISTSKSFAIVYGEGGMAATVAWMRWY